MKTYERKRNLLIAIRDYMQAMVDNRPDTLKLSDRVRATYNGEEVPAGMSELWTQVVRFSSRQSFTDDKTDTAVLFATVTNEARFDNAGKKYPKAGIRAEDVNRSQTKWWFYFLRLTLEDDKILEIEEITIPEKLIHFDVHSSDYPRRIAAIDSYVPESERSDRQEMISIADTYWDAVQKTIKPEEVLAHPDADRLEMGVQCTNALRNFHTVQSCFRSPTFLWKIENRRWYVVDEERGVVVCLATFRQIDDKTPPGFIAAELFKIEAGLIKDVIAFFKPMCTKAGWGEE